MNADIFNKLSLNAKVALRHASQISLQTGSADIDPVHIFLGIISTKKSLAVRILKSLEFSVQDLMKIFPEYTGITLDKKTSQNSTKIYLSKESADVLRESFRFANQMSHVYVGTEHILANLLLRKDLQFVKILQRHGLKYQNYQEAMLNVATYPIGILAKPEQVDREVDFGQSPLATLGSDLVEAARRGEFDPLYDREKELDQLIKILSRRKKNNPIIVGEAGVGKTALVEGLAQKIAEGNVPTSLLNTKIFSLDIPSIIANSKLRGDVEEKVIAIIKEVSESSNTIVFIDEIHNILASGAPGGGIDIASILKPALLKDSFRCIGATTVEEYTQYFEEDNALARRFQHIMLEEPSEESSLKILERTKDLIEKHHHVVIQEGAIVSAVKLSDRYISDRYLPDKAIDLLDEAAAVKRMEVESKYKTASKLYIRSKEMALLKRDAIRRGDMDSARNYRDEEKILEGEIKRMEARRAETMESKEFEVGAETVRKVISEWTGIPLATLDLEESKKLLNFENILSKSIIGQKEAVSAVASAIKRARAGISSPNRPWASFLFLGPTGVGKSELAKVLTREIFGDEDRLIQIDMSEMMEMHSVSKLIGSPPGYVGYREGGQLTEMVRQNPHSVILFDEIEKAHEDVLNILLQILEYGHLTDGKGKRVNFKNTIIILTSNIGAEAIREDKVIGFAGSNISDKKAIETAYETMKSELIKILKGTLKPELINRLDDIVIFRSLTKADAKLIVDILIKDLNKRLEDSGIYVEIDKKVRDALVRQGFSSEYGARPLRRVVQEQIENKLAEWMLAHNVEEREKTSDFSTIQFVVREKNIVILDE